MESDILRKIQLAQLEMLKDFSAFCDRKHLTCFICYGTLLGAIRHDGFIPWDDDIDIGMPRKDYDRFIHMAKQEFDNEKYYCLSWEHYPDFGLPYAKIKKKGTLFVEEKRGRSKYNELFIDIFPFDNYPGTLRALILQGIPLAIMGLLIRLKTGIKPYNGKHNRYKYIIFEIISLFFKTEWLQKRYDVLARRYNRDQHVFLIPRVEDAKPLKWVIKRNAVLPTCEVNFENELFKAPGNPADFLIASYEDYMKLPPESERKNRHRIVECRL